MQVLINHRYDDAGEFAGLKVVVRSSSLGKKSMEFDSIEGVVEALKTNVVALVQEWEEHRLEVHAKKQAEKAEKAAQGSSALLGVSEFDEADDDAIHDGPDEDEDGEVDPDHYEEA